MGSQQSSRLKANRNPTPIKQTTTELGFIFKRPIFWRPSYIAQSAWLEHIPFAFWLVDTLQPRKIVELGSHYGSSYFSFCQAVAKLDLDTKCYAVDTWGGDVHAGQYGEEVYQQVSEHNQQHYSDFSSLVRSTFDQALEHFPQSSIDLLHIDGLHTLDAVRHDFESWLPKLSDRAVVIMHDTNVRERGFGVFQLMDELKQQYPHFEFAHGHGLGVIGVGSQQSPEMLSLYGLSGNASGTRQVQEVFSRLGKACGYSWENKELKRQMVVQQDNQQAETLEAMEQQALERGRLAERITAQHHTLKSLEDKLAQRGDQSTEFISQQQLVSTLTTELVQSKQNITDAQAMLTLCGQQRDQSLVIKQHLEAELAVIRAELEQTHSERDQFAKEMQALVEQKSAAEEKQNVLRLQLHEQELNLNEEVQRSAQLTLALNKNNVLLNDYSQQINTQQHRIDELTSMLKAAHQQQDELSQTLATEAAHWQELFRERAQTIDKQNLELEETCGQLRTLKQQHQIEKRESQHQLDQLNQSLGERFAEIATLTQWLGDREQDIAKGADEHAFNQQAWHAEQAEMKNVQAVLQQELIAIQQATSQQKAHLEEKATNLVKQNAKLEENISERFRELAAMTRHTEHLSRQLQQKEQQLQKAKDRAQNLKQTVSWKLTAPVRALGRTFKDGSASKLTATINRAEHIATSGLFNEAWYLQRYPEVADSGMTAIEHFIQVGADKSYCPSELFDTSWYLENYNDVAQGTINPLIHYILHGKAEQRHCLPENMRE